MIGKCSLYLTKRSVAFLFPKAKKCIPVNLPRGFLSCSNPNGPFTFGSLCTATCERGFALNGTVSIECTSLGLWSADVPQCLGKEITLFGNISRLSVFYWPHPLFVCLSAKQCPALGSPAHGSLVCSAPHGEFSFGARCRSTCQEGFLLNGTAGTECTSQGMWSTETPHCLGKKSFRERNGSCLDEERPICCYMRNGILFDAVHSTALPPAGHGSTKRAADLQPPTFSFKLRIPLWIWMSCGFPVKRSINHNVQQFRRLGSGSTHLPAWVLVPNLESWYSWLCS